MGQWCFHGNEKRNSHGKHGNPTPPRGLFFPSHPLPVVCEQMGGVEGNPKSGRVGVRGFRGFRGYFFLEMRLNTSASSVANQLPEVSEKVDGRHLVSSDHY